MSCKCLITTFFQRIDIPELFCYILILQICIIDFENNYCSTKISKKTAIFFIFRGVKSSLQCDVVITDMIIDIESTLMIFDCFQTFCKR